MTKADAYHITTCPYCTHTNNCGGTKSLVEAEGISVSPDANDLFCNAIDLYIAGVIDYDKLDKLQSMITHQHIATARSEINYFKSKLPTEDHSTSTSDVPSLRVHRAVPTLTKDTSGRMMWNNSMLRHLTFCSHEATREIQTRMRLNDQIIHG